MKKLIPLAIIIAFGVALRAYNIDFPSIGYHNMNENEALSIADHMRRSGNLLERRAHFINPFEEDSAGSGSIQPPLTSYQILFAWNIFGENLWGGRVLNVFFGAVSIIFMYLIASYVCASVSAALFASFLMAIMPVAVFFSRNLQPESPAMCFMLLGVSLYLRFAARLKRYYLFAAGLCIALAFLYRINFAIAIIPCLCYIWPVMFRGGRRERIFSWVVFLAPFFILSAIVWWLVRVNYLGLSELQNLRLFDVFSLSFWNAQGRSIWWYASVENFTATYTIGACAGIVIACLMRRSPARRFIIGWVIALLPYGMLFSQQLHQQSYSQLPFIPLVCMGSAYSVQFIAEGLKKAYARSLFIPIAILAVIISAPSVKLALHRAYMTIFPGEDVAGATLRDLTRHDERVFLLTNAQGFGIARYARRYMGWPRNLEDFKAKENSFNVRYICIYPVSYLELLSREQPQLFEYMQGHYHIREIGYLDGTDQLYYFILERGRGEDFKKALSSISGRQRLRAIYKIFNRLMYFYSIEVEQVS